MDQFDAPRLVLQEGRLHQYRYLRDEEPAAIADYHDDYD
jgi:hypothetical protein